MKNEIENAISKTYDYFFQVFKMQKRIVEFDLMYGDGTIFKPLTKAGAKLVYDELADATRKINSENFVVSTASDLLKACYIALPYLENAMSPPNDYDFQERTERDFFIIKGAIEKAEGK